MVRGRAKHECLEGAERLEGLRIGAVCRDEQSGVLVLRCHTDAFGGERRVCAEKTVEATLGTAQTNTNTGDGVNDAFAAKPPPRL